MRTDRPMWVVGCIDSYGAITARVCNDDNIMHGPEESRGKRWRWNVWGQDFHATLNFDHLTDEEWFIVSDWLVKHGHKHDED